MTALFDIKDSDKWLSWSLRLRKQLEGEGDIGIDKETREFFLDYTRGYG